MIRPRNCLACTWCQLRPYEQGYSEMTPSSPLTFSCWQGKWDIEDCQEKADLGAHLDRALTCAEWSPEPGHEDDTPGATK